MKRNLGSVKAVEEMEDNLETADFLPRGTQKRGCRRRFGEEECKRRRRRLDLELIATESQFWLWIVKASCIR